jgi:hypothetical protein
MIPKNIKLLQAQSKNLRARRTGRHTVVVESATEPELHYTVHVRFGEDGKVVQTTCDCEWAKHSGVACSHVMAALEHLAKTKGRNLSFWTSEEAAQRQKQRTFFLTAGNPGNGVWITSRTG